MEYDPTQPLPDSDLVLDDSLATEIANELNGAADTPPAPAAVTTEKKSRRRFTFGDDYMSVIVREPGSVAGSPPDVSTFNLDDVKSNTVAYAHAAAFGVSVLLGRSDNMLAEFTRIVSGGAAERKEPKAKAVPPNFWRQAIALAYVDATKKAPSGQMTIEAATAKANGLERGVMMRLKGDPAVIKHHNKLTGATTGYSVKALLEAEEAAA